MSRLGNEIRRRVTIGRLAARLLLPPVPVPLLPVRVMGLDFRNPLGLAAGFDRTGRLLALCAGVGFGFVDIGTILPDRADTVLARLLEADSGPCRISANIGSRRPGLGEDVRADYVASLRSLAPAADMVVANLSCRRAARLRGAGPAALAPFLRGLGVARDRLAERLGRRLRLAVKLDMGAAAAGMAAEIAAAAGFDGVVAVGGDIGSLVTRIAPVPVIAVGGITDSAATVERVRQGAALVAVYAAFIRHGAATPRRLLAGLSV